ncbi:hypothetical protein [Streptomyces sp. enrichment culture]|uniref:hypothetical protein n=1 Tax=Streptomyces sp. enrichment culture TaxID=1795815 RepID=UPI003F57D928
MKARFLLGLLFGAAGSGIAWAVTDSLGWTALVGITVTVAVWFGEFIFGDLI